MKTRALKTIAAILSVLMLVAVLPLSGMAAGYAAGDIILLGSYPQSEVTDGATLSALNAQTLNWVSYDYYRVEYSRLKKSDFMKYADVSYSGNKYRAVQFTDYRPNYTDDYPISADISFQDDNGYNTNTIYWFKYEPLQWRVLDPDAGLVLCENGIDVQAFNYRCYYVVDVSYNRTGAVANDYATSDIREWLNADFYNTAFSPSEKEGIYAKALDNSMYGSNQYGTHTNTTDKIFLLSSTEITNANYGFSTDENAADPARKLICTDYAKCLNAPPAAESDDFNGWERSGWWLRSPYNNMGQSCYMWEDGTFDSERPNAQFGSVRPAVILKPDSSIPPKAPEDNRIFIDKMAAVFRYIIILLKIVFFG